MKKSRFHARDGAKKENPPLEQRVPFFDLRYSMQYGYVMEPRVPTAMFTRHYDHCARQYHAFTNDRERADQYKCKKQCDLCKQVCTETDYIRGFLPPNYPVPAVQYVPEVVVTKEGKPYWFVFFRCYPSKGWPMYWAAII